MLVSVLVSDCPPELEKPKLDVYIYIINDNETEYRELL